MPKGPNDSPIKVTPAMEEQIANALSAEDIKKVFRDAMLEQNLVEADPYDPSLLHVREEAAPAAATAPRFGARVTVDGKTHIAEGASQAEADAKIVEVIRAVTHQTRDDQGRFTTDQGRSDEATAKAIEQELLRKSDLELRFKRGDITTADYLAQSGAIEGYLGVSAEDLRSTVEEKSNQRFTQSWADASTEFMNTAEGKIWPGGEANKVKMIEVLTAMGATDAPNSENMRRAAEYMRENNMIEITPELERDRLIRAATSPEEIAAALHGEKFSRPGSAATWQARKWNGHG